MSLHSEICEQPVCLERLLRTQKQTAEKIAAAILKKDIHFVFIAARGTSETAGRYAKYLWGVKNALPIAFAAPSLFTYYNHPPQLRSALVVGISQSGRSPDIVSVLTEGKRQGCPTLAITNDVASPLANAADFVLDIGAGDENAVAATKTYSTELMSIAMLSSALRNSSSMWKDLEKIPEWMRLALQTDDEVNSTAQHYHSITNCVVLGRGFNYPTAYEWGLKLKELTYMKAAPYSSADFMHGPIAIVDGSFPIFAIVTNGAVAKSLIDLLQELRYARNVNLLTISDLNEVRQLAQYTLQIPEGIPEWLSPMVTIVPAQLFCYHLARAKGCDTESPRGIHKVTETR
ncbi:MAG TPA: SIS domain-containing protein [Acidobacteriota bacterium]|nr:SIS domain-containing protein [Acidobacteriota bacterium]